MAHKMHNRKYKPPMNKMPQYEVLQPYIKFGKPLQGYFIGSKIVVYYKSDLELICASKSGSISDPCTIQAPLQNPLRVFNKTPSTRCRSEI